MMLVPVALERRWALAAVAEEPLSIQSVTPARVVLVVRALL